MSTATQKHTKVNFRPLSDRVLLKRVSEASETVGGIILPESAQKKQATALVVAVGPGKSDHEGKLSAMTVSVGDSVLIEKYAGQEVSIDSEEYMIVRNDDIIAVIES